MVLFREAAGHMVQASTAYLDGVSYAKHKHWNQLSHPKKWN